MDNDAKKKLLLINERDKLLDQLDDVKWEKQQLLKQQADLTAKGLIIALEEVISRETLINKSCGRGANNWMDH